ncbi:MAG: hypothetical protein V2J10_06175 [Wenzhouxiangella sp.]|jgi:hypothetical protein|nr:hypothetical protein [Wenzhouxiangella sp.]
MRTTRLKSLMLIMLIGVLAVSLIGLHHYLQPEPATDTTIPKKIFQVP